MSKILAKCEGKFKHFLQVWSLPSWRVCICWAWLVNFVFVLYIETVCGSCYGVWVKEIRRTFYSLKEMDDILCVASNSLRTVPIKSEFSLKLSREINDHEALCVDPSFGDIFSGGLSFSPLDSIITSLIFLVKLVIIKASMLILVFGTNPLAWNCTIESSIHNIRFLKVSRFFTKHIYVYI